MSRSMTYAISLMIAAHTTLVRNLVTRGKVWKEFGSNEYYVETEKREDHEVAAEECMKLSAKLAVIKDEKIFNALNAMIPYATAQGETHSYFIGLERTGEGPHEFQWEDGTSADGGQTFWAKGEPSNSSNDYVILEKTGKSGSKMKWRNVGNVKAQFICEREREFIVDEITRINDKVAAPPGGENFGNITNNKRRKIAPRREDAEIGNDVIEKPYNSIMTDDGAVLPQNIKGTSYTMLTSIGVVALGAVAVATIVFVISYFLERRSTHFV